MEHSPANPLVTLYISQLLFGVLYAALIHWLSVNEYLQGSTAYSVVIGDAVTLLIQWVFIHQDWSPLVTFGSFVFSGLPMVVTYLFRHEQKKQSHKRRPVPGFVIRILNDVVMEIKSILNQIVNEGAPVVSVVHRLHEVVGKLKSIS